VILDLVEEDKGTMRRVSSDRSYIRLRLQAADNLTRVPTTGSIRCHQLSLDRDEQFAIDLVHPKRLVFEADHDPIPRQEDGGINKAKVTQVVIVARLVGADPTLELCKSSRFYTEWWKNGAQGRNRTLAYPTESPSFFEWRLSSVPTSGPGALRAREGATLCPHIKIVRVTVYERSSALCRIPS
jgi:hypothetical protein